MNLTDDESAQFHVPAGGKWFWKQDCMLEEHKTSPGFTVAWDKGVSGKRIYGLYPDPFDFYRNLLNNPKSLRWAYELIPEATACKGYMDIEWIGPPDPGHSKLSMIIYSLRTKVKEQYSINPEIFVACGTRRSKADLLKHSYHVVVDNLVFQSNHEGDMKRFFQLEEEEDWYYQDKNGNRKYVIDLGVYTKNRLFRLPLCCKHRNEDPTSTPLVRISQDAYEDDFSMGSSENIDDNLPFIVSNPDMDGDKFIVPRDPTIVATQNSTGSPRSKPKDGKGGKESKRRVHLLMKCNKKPLTFPLDLLRELLEKSGDNVSIPTTVGYHEDPPEWQVQCDQAKKARKCLVSPEKTHDSNNCLLFITKWNGIFRVKYHCTASECASCVKPILGYVKFGTDLEWHTDIQHEEEGEGGDDTKDDAGTGMEEQSISDGISEPDSSMDAEQTESMVDYDNPAMNTYELVKLRHELICFKVMTPPVYAHIVSGDKEPDMMTFTQVRNYFTNKYYYERDSNGMYTKQKFITRWMDDENIRLVREIVVDPVCSEEDVYNLWKPFKAATLPPVDDSLVQSFVEPIINHISHVITGGNEEHTGWILDYIANMVQRPEKKTQVAISLYGEEGCGKGIIFEFLRKEVMGSFCSFQTATPENDLFGRFANGALHRVFIQVDEVKSLHEHNDKLKDFITNETLNYEKKGKDTIVVKNISNLLLTSNNENALTVSSTDRRFALFRCSSVHRGNREYFNELGKHLKSPKVARAFYQFLMGRDLSMYPYDFQSSRPITEYYKETQLAGIPVLARFLSALVNDDMSLNYKSRDLYDNYKRFHVEGNYKFLLTETSFSREIQRITGISRRRTCNGTLFEIDRETVKKTLMDSNKYDPDVDWK